MISRGVTLILGIKLRRPAVDGLTGKAPAKTSQSFGIQRGLQSTSSRALTTVRFAPQSYLFCISIYNSSTSICSILIRIYSIAVSCLSISFRIYSICIRSYSILISSDSMFISIDTTCHRCQTSTSLRRRCSLDSRIQTAPSSQRRRSLKAMEKCFQF